MKQVSFFRCYLFTLLLIAVTCLSFASSDSEQMIPEKVVYKETEQGSLKLHIFDARQGRSNRPAIVFFFGGGWRSGSPSQFYPHCRFLAQKGIVAISAEYRVRSRHKTTPTECVKDGKSAVRWIRNHAVQLGVDPNRIAAAGGSAGGHVAACTALIKELDEEGEDLAISSVPNALVLFNPVVDTSVVPIGLDENFGFQMQRISPLQQIRPGVCPTIIFHGTADKAVSIETVRRFQEKMEKSGNSCELFEFEGMGHAFFNYGRHGNKPFWKTITRTNYFLMELEYIKSAEFGVPAPDLKDLQWIKGDKVQFEQGHVYVVEFWATWCPPCLRSIPHLTALQKKYKDQKVAVIGISKEDERQAIASFVQEKGSKMDYAVAWDPLGKVDLAYKGIYGQTAIPTTFIVDQKKRIVWMGSPLEDLESVLDQVLAGAFDYVEYAREKAGADALAKQISEWGYRYFILIRQDGPNDQTRALAQKIIEKASAGTLNALAWDILTKVKEGRQELDIALIAAEKANQLTQEKDPAILDTLALAQFKNGKVMQAIKTQQKAVDYADGRMKTELRKRLTEFKQKAALVDN